MSLFEEIKMLIDLVDDGYITEKEFDKLVDKKKAERENAKLDDRLRSALDSLVREFEEEKEKSEPFDFVDQEVAVPYTDDKDDFDLWKERNNIDESVKFNRHIYKGEVYWMEAGSDSEKDLLAKIYNDKFIPNQMVDYPSSPHVPSMPPFNPGQPFNVTPPSHQYPYHYLGGGWGSGGITHPHPMWGSDVSVESLKGTILSSEHNV